MARGNFAACNAEVLAHEGGYSNDRRDPGNWTGGKVGVGELRGTKKGIAAASYPALDIKNLSDAEINSIYEKRYWRPLQCEAMQVGVDYAVYDYGVNSGISRSAKHSQAVVGVVQDGKVGPQTLAAIANMGAAKFIKALCAKRMSFLQSLAIWNTFGRGWSRRVASVEAKALSWVLSRSQLEAEAKAAREKAGAQAAGAVVSGAGGNATASQIPDASGFPWWVVLLGAAVIAAPLVIRAIVNAQRAQAISQAAKEA